MLIRGANHDHFRQSTNNPNTSIILFNTIYELVYMVDLEEVNNALRLTFPSLEFIKIITTYGYFYYEVRYILVMRKRDKLYRKVESKQRIIAYDTDSIYKECCKAARRFMNKDTGQGGELNDT